MQTTKLSNKWNTKTGHLRCCLPRTGFTTCSATNDNGRKCQNVWIPTAQICDHGTGVFCSLHRSICLPAWYSANLSDCGNARCDELGFTLVKRGEIGYHNIENEMAISSTHIVSPKLKRRYADRGELIVIGDISVFSGKRLRTNK